jgi:hypothetical protein
MKFCVSLSQGDAAHAAGHCDPNLGKSGTHEFVRSVPAAPRTRLELSSGAYLLEGL